MQTKTLYKLFIVIAILAVGLTSCNLTRFLGGGEEQGDFNQIETIAAATVSARFTQSAYETLVAQLTQVAATGTSTPGPSSTPLPTNTPIATFTPVAPTATTKPPTATAVPIPCNAATYIADVTIADGTSIIQEDSFVKTWRIKNAGTCTWSTDYKIYFYSGTQMGAASSVTFPKSVKPGDTVDLSVAMVAPGGTGNYTGNWLLKASDGKVFGVGPAFNAALTVNIKVIAAPAPKDTNTKYDLVGNFCDATWRTNAGEITCPSTQFDTSNGSITRSYAPVLAGGYVDDEGAIYTVPAKGGDGMIEGKYPKFLIKDGYHFRALLFCANGYPKCDVTVELNYVIAGGGGSGSLGSWGINYNNGMPIDVDLSTLVGKEVRLVLKVISKGDSTDDVVLWEAARITVP